MITIFKSKKDIPQDKEYIELNDIFFNQNTATKLDDRAAKYIQMIDSSELISKYKIRSRFEDITLNTDQLSTGCKTVQKDVKEIIRQTEGKLVVIDNADILLDDDTRKYISLDDKNQYLIIGRNPKNLFATKENLFELASEKIGEQTKFTIEPYM